MKKIFTKEFVIGLSVIIALLILFFGIDFLKGINLFKPANFYYANYQNVSGLETSAPVMINGFKVGQVREISIDYEHPGSVKVLFALDKQLKVPEDSKAEIVTELLGGAYINLTMGKSRTYIPIGSEIKTGISPNILSSVTDELMPKVNNILPMVDTLLFNLNHVVSDPAIKSSLMRIDGITNNILVASSGLNSMMNQQVPAMLNQVPPIINNAGRVVYNIDTITANLAILSSQLKNLPLESTMANVENTTKNLEQFSNQLNNTKSTLGLLMNDPELYNKLNRVTADIDSLIIDIKKNPKRYISIKLL